MLIDLKVNDFTQTTRQILKRSNFLWGHRDTQAQEKNCHLNLVIEGGSKTNYLHLFKSEVILETVGR